MTFALVRLPPKRIREEAKCCEEAKKRSNWEALTHFLQCKNWSSRQETDISTVIYKYKRKKD